MTPTESEILRRASKDLLRFLDADALGSCTGSAPTEAEALQVDEALSIADRLMIRLLDPVRPPLEPGFDLHQVYDNPSLWFHRFGAVALVSTALEARERARLQAALGERQVSARDMPVALAMGETAKAAIADAAVVLSALHRNPVQLAFELGMYATAMAIGRRYEAELRRFSRQVRSVGFDQFVDRALHTSRLAACREFRQAASDLQSV